MNKLVVVLLIIYVVGFAQEVGARYLIVTHDSFYDAIQPLAEWKHRKGMSTKVAKLSETGSSAAEIKNFIQNAYNTWQTTPEFLLLVGAPSYLPWGSSYSDNYYMNMDVDIFNEILGGRLTVHNSTEAQTVVNKILMYESLPDISDSMWFINACLVKGSGAGSSIHWDDIHHAKTLMLQNGYNIIDTLADEWGNDASDIVQAVDSGRAFVLYRGSNLGGGGNWSNPFGVNPDVTQNGSKLPIVLSITGRTIGTSSTPATAERWLLTGQPLLPRGGAGYFATTTSTYDPTLGSAVCQGFFSAVFQEGKRTFGEACENGRINVYNMHGSVSEYQGYATLGDPEMNIWTAIPKPLDVSHDSQLFVFDDSLVISVYFQNVPFESALVCVLLDTLVYQYGYTASDGKITFYFDTLETGIMDVTVTALNRIPHLDSILIVTPSGPYIVLGSTDLHAGANGQVNPGESVGLGVWAENVGVAIADDVYGILTSADPYISLIVDSSWYGTIPANDSALSNPYYQFAVADSCPNNHAVGFDLEFHDVNDSIWISHLGIVVYAPILTYHHVTVMDTNGVVDPGETVDIAVTIENEGGAAAENVTSVLTSNSSYIAINDNSGSFGTVAAGDTANNSADPYNITADSTTPNGTLVDFEIIITSGVYVDTLYFSLVLGRKHYFIWNPDSTPTPGENMHVILDSLGYVGDYGTTLAADLSLYQSVFVCVGVYPNNYIINSSSFEASALVDFLENQNGRMYLEGGDVWYYDPPIGYDFGPLFGIDAVDDGNSDLGPVVGENGAFTTGMDFGYDGENNFIDHIDAMGTGFLVFHDGDNSYNCGVANNAGIYRTVGTSFELGLLLDGATPSTRKVLLDSIMDFFEIGGGTGVTEHTVPSNKPLQTGLGVLYPNPVYRVMSIRYQLAQPSEVSLSVYNPAGRFVRKLAEGNQKPGYYMAFWDGQDESGRKMPSGVYFVEFETSDYRKSEKAILIR